MIPTVPTCIPNLIPCTYTEMSCIEEENEQKLLTYALLKGVWPCPLTADDLIFRRMRHLTSDPT